jgi:hypothetical protein
VSTRPERAPSPTPKADVEAHEKADVEADEVFVILAGRVLTSSGG